MCLRNSLYFYLLSCAIILIRAAVAVLCPVIGLAVQNDIQIFNIAEIERINSECRSVLWESYNVVGEVKCCVGVAACVVEKSCSIICSNIIAFAGLCIVERNSLCVSLCRNECINIDSACVYSFSIVALADSFLELSLISFDNASETVSLCLLNRVGEVGHFCIAVGDLLICIRCQSNTTLSDSGVDNLSNILEVAVLDRYVSLLDFVLNICVYKVGFAVSQTTGRNCFNDDVNCLKKYFLILFEFTVYAFDT